MLSIPTLLPMNNLNNSLFVHTKSDERSTVLIYIDNLIITGDNNAAITNLKRVLYQKFIIKNLGVLKYLIDIEIAPSHKKLFFNQRKYMLDLLH